MLAELGSRFFAKVTRQGQAGWEWDLLIAAMALALLLAGSGLYGIDSLLGLLW